MHQFTDPGRGKINQLVKLDAHFLLPELGLTAAQLEPSRKNALSHRGQAMGELLSKLRRLPEARYDAVTS